MKKIATKEIPLDQLYTEPLAEELMRQPEAQPYDAFTDAILTGADIKPALEQIKALPPEKRYISRIIRAFGWALADFDTDSIRADMQVLSDEEWKNLAGNDFIIRPIQFCLLLKPIFGADQMERIMSEAISYAKESSEGSM